MSSLFIWIVFAKTNDVKFFSTLFFQLLRWTHGQVLWTHYQVSWIYEILIWIYDQVSWIYDEYYGPMVKDPVLSIKWKIDKDDKFSNQFPWQARPTLVPWRGCNLVKGLLRDIDIQTCDEEADGGVVSVPFDILHDHGTLLHRQVLDVPCQITTTGEEVTAKRAL